jgi:hypothetical protein
MKLLLEFIASSKAFSASETATSMAGGTGTPPKHCGKAIHSCSEEAAGE